MSAEDGPDVLAGLQQALDEPEPHLDPQVIADRLVWPTVNRLWVPGDDWRKEATPGATLEVPKSDIKKGVAIEVQLSADCRLKEEDECNGYEDELVHGVTLELRRELSEETCDLLLTELRMKSPGVLEEVPRGDIVARRVLSYFFDTEGAVGVHEAQMIRDVNGDQECYPGNMDQYDPTPSAEGSAWTDEDDGEYVTSDLALVPTRLREHDLSEISLAVNVLTRSMWHQRIVKEIVEQAIKPV